MYYTIKNIMLIILFSSLSTRIIWGQMIGSWFSTDSLHIKRSDAASIQLNNGNILITGGYVVNQVSASNDAELFDIKTKKWNTTFPMCKGRGMHDLIKLRDGSILAIGGYDENSCEILSNDYTKWSFTDSLKRKRFYGQRTVLMDDGNVLVTGGYSYFSANNPTEALKECEIYYYLEKKWEAANDMNISRRFHTATLLKNGKVLVTGGNGGIKSCEIFDNVTKLWTSSAPMNYGRSMHSATLLSNGKVLVIGGGQKISELYNPLSDTWAEVGVVTSVSGNQAIKLVNEEYLLLIDSLEPYWELYSLSKYKSIYSGKFPRKISSKSITKINENEVILAGGLETIIVSTPVIVYTSFCQIYAINSTSVKGTDNYNNPVNNISLSCYPNPFNNSTNITIELKTSDWISLKLYNVLGESAKTIYDGNISIGKHLFQLNINNLASGIYFVRLNSIKFTKLIKVIHQK